ncbi:MAG: diguanylate cyclase [Cytophagaceae bacterium]|nr:diguanylate cyclase [Gemmatimonadaceae bacterium]
MIRGDDGRTTGIALDLARLEEQAGEARARLARLHLELAEVERRLGAAHGAHLVEANEQLVVAAMRAQTEAERAAQALIEVSRAAEHDALTGLPNRVLMLDRLSHAIAGAERHGARLALLFVDLNDFKQVNDTFGHQFGDEVLRRVASCLTSSVRASDTVCRHGGDEFVILIDQISQVSDAMVIAAKVLANLAAETRIGDHDVRLTASIGIGIYPDDGGDPNTLLDRADAAMYTAKRHGVGSFLSRGMAPGRSAETSAVPGAPRTALTLYDSAMAAYDRQYAELRETNTQLVVAALGAMDLQAAAEEAHRRQSEFLAVVAHELRNPLMPIQSSAALLGMVQTEEPLLRRVQDIIERQVAHMLRLVGDLLDISRVNTGKLSLERREVDLAGVIKHVLENRQPTMIARRQHLQPPVLTGPLVMYGDPVRLAQIFSNLLDNASKYTPIGGQISLTATEAGASVVITVSDTGIGITPDTLPHVFDLFRQDTHAIVFSSEGLGIGLTVVRELVIAHGGTVVATSAGRGLGSQFTVTLPLVPAETEG